MNITNLQRLLRVGENIIAEQFPIGFNKIDCGTYACWCGWYLRAIGVELNEWNYLSFVKEHFDIPEPIALELFAVAGFNHRIRTVDRPHPSDEPGQAAYVELGRRLGYLRNLIAQARPKPVGIPESVRAIFDAPAIEPVSLVNSEPTR